MISRREITRIFISINAGGVVLSLLYGVFGGSGGETTEGVFIALFFTNILSIFFGLIIVFVKFSWWRNNFIWGLPVLLIFYPVTSLVLENEYHNLTHGKSYVIANSTKLGSVSNSDYVTDKMLAQEFLKNEKNDSSGVDTIIYSKDLSKAIVFCSYEILDSIKLFRNFELFAVKKNAGMNFHFPKEGNLMSENVNKDKLRKEVLDWYLEAYSADPNSSMSLWNYTDFW